MFISILEVQWGNVYGIYRKVEYRWWKLKNEAEKASQERWTES